MNQRDKQIVRDWAKRYMELAQSDEQIRMNRRMKDTNDLKITRPPVLIDEIPWYQMDIDGELKCECEDGGARGAEYFFRTAVYRRKHFRADTLYAVTELLRRGEDIASIHEKTMITELFLESLKKITEMENRLKAAPGDIELLREAKKMGFGDQEIGILWNRKETEIYAVRKENGIIPVFRMVDTLHTGKYIAYLYSSYSNKNDSILTEKKKIVVLGAGPIRIGQGVEFDYSTVHAVQTIRRAGYEAIIINNNPETVSTDYTTADKLYFEPLTPEDVMAIMEALYIALQSLWNNTRKLIASNLDLDLTACRWES